MSSILEEQKIKNEDRNHKQQLISCFVAYPALLYLFQSAARQMQAIFPSRDGRSFSASVSDAMRSRVSSKDRLRLVSGGRLCALLTQRLFFFNCKLSVDNRLAARLGMRVLSRRHLLHNSSPSCVATLKGHKRDSTCVAFHPTAPLLATGSVDKTVILWRLSPDNSPATHVATLTGHYLPVTCVAFHPTAPLLATDGFEVKIWLLSPDNSSANCVETMSHYACSVAFHPTALLLASGGDDKTVILWRLSPDNSSATRVAILRGHKMCVTSVAFHHTKPLLATGSKDKTVILWHLSSDNSSATCVATLAEQREWVPSFMFLRPTWESVYASYVAFHPTSPILATSSEDNTVKLWRLSSDNSSATCVANLKGHTGFINSIAFHPTAPLLATGGCDRTVRLWRLSSDSSSATCVAILAAKSYFNTVQNPEGYRCEGTSVDFHPTEPVLATVIGGEHAKLWR